MNKFKIFGLILGIILSVNTMFAAPLQGDAKTKRLPAGTKLSIQLLDTIDTHTAQDGDYFSAMLLTEQKSNTSVILPSGSIIRGSIDKIKHAKLLSKGAVLYLYFDHIVTPAGRQLPLTLYPTGLAKVTYDGGLYESKGYGEALQLNWEKTKEIASTATNWGISTGETFEGLQYVATPIAAVGGACAGGIYFLGDSIIDIFRKGKDVVLDKGTKLDVILVDPIDVPVN